MDRKQLSLIAAICGGVFFIAMLMPVVTTQVTGLPFGGGGARGASGNGFDWGGALVVAFLFSLAAGAAALLVYLGKTDVVPLDGRQLLFAGVGGFGVALLLVLITFFDGDFQSTSQMGVTASVSRGFGLYLMFLASLAGGAACFMATKQAPASGGGGGGGGGDD